MKNLFWVFTVATTLFVIGCAKGEIEMLDCSNDAPTYTDDVKSILDASCGVSGCHDADRQARGLDFTDYSTSVASVEKDADEFLGSIQHIDGFSTMPRGGSKAT